MKTIFTIRFIGDEDVFGDSHMPDNEIDDIILRPIRKEFIVDRLSSFDHGDTYTVELHKKDFGTL